MSFLYGSKSRKGLFGRKLKTFLIADSLSRLSARNELNDFKQVLDSADDELWELHRDLESIRHDLKANYESYDYGCGYYYQSFPAIKVSGFRNTGSRVSELDLDRRVEGKRVLDIGSNTGFLLLSLADKIQSGVGVEFNPFLVAAANRVALHMDTKNIHFIASSFENFGGELFDIVFSLANHCTYDGNTKHSTDEYFSKIAEHLAIGGQLIFESHPPKIEPKDKLDKTVGVIEKYFDITEQPRVEMSGFLDKERHYIVAVKK